MAHEVNFKWHVIFRFPPSILCINGITVSLDKTNEQAKNTPICFFLKQQMPVYYCTYKFNLLALPLTLEEHHFGKLPAVHTSSTKTIKPFPVVPYAAKHFLTLMFVEICHCLLPRSGSHCHRPEISLCTAGHYIGCNWFL